MPTIMIIGANFVNKGAQSMLFTTIDAIRSKFPQANILFAHGDECDISNYKFEEVYYSEDAVRVTLGDHSQRIILERYIKDFVKKIIGRKIEKTNFQQLKKVMPKVDLLVDVSGFALGSKWGDGSVYRYIYNVKLAQKYKIPFILMPQSFGDFVWKKDGDKLDDLLRKYMRYPLKIFAREKDGEIPLREKYGLRNVALHPDMVLCSTAPDLSLIYKKVPDIQVPQVESDHSVGILPNMRSFDHGNKVRILGIFQQMITRLLEKGKMVYLFRHSFEDLTACRWIKEMFPNEERVVLWENDFSCFEYDAVCRQFEFLVVGRFHGIVHAYRNSVPCIILGWAVKYQELSELMGQTPYVFDITAQEVDQAKIIAAMDEMDEHLQENKAIIKDRLAKVQKKSTCFEVMLKGIEDVVNKKMVH